MSKGVSEVATAALYVGITVSAISVALTTGVPAIQNMQDASAISQAENFMHSVDSNIQEVVAEGQGSSRSLDINFDRGEIYFDNATEALVYELETDAEVISPQSAQRTGNVILSSNANVQVFETEVDGEECYMMRNEHIDACIRRVGGPEDFESIDTGDLLLSYNFTSSDPEKALDADMDIRLNDVEETSYGEGFTEAENTGDFIGTGRVTATVYSDYGFVYDVEFALPTGADFLVVDVKNFR